MGQRGTEPGPLAGVGWSSVSLSPLPWRLCAWRPQLSKVEEGAPDVSSKVQVSEELHWEESCSAVLSYRQGQAGAAWDPVTQHPRPDQLDFCPCSTSLLLGSLLGLPAVPVQDAGSLGSQGPGPVPWQDERSRPVLSHPAHLRAGCHRTYLPLHAVLRRASE